MAIKLKRPAVPSCSECGHNKLEELQVDKVTLDAAQGTTPAARCNDATECARRAVLANLDVKSTWVF